MDTSIYRRSWPGSPTNKQPKAYLSRNNDPSKKQNSKDSDAEQQPKPINASEYISTPEYELFL